MYGTLRRLSWHVTRLRAMERGEVTYRVREAVRRRRFSHNAKGWSDFDRVGDGEVGVFPQLAERLTAANETCADILSAAQAGFITISLRFLCHHDLDVSRNDAGIMISGPAGELLTMAVPHGFSMHIHEASMSPRFGELVPTRQIVLSGGMAPGAVVGTGIALSARIATVQPARGDNIVAASWAAAPARDFPHPTSTGRGSA